MTPLADLTDEVFATVAGVASDFDDTLTAHHTLTRASLDALHALATAGIPCVIVTGRPLGWGEVLARTLPVRAVVTENGGAWVEREGARLRVAYLEDESTRAAGMSRVDAVVDALCAEFPQLARVRDLTARATDVALDINEVAHVPEDIVARAAERVRAAGLHAVASSVHLHVSARAPDKFQGLRACVGDLGLDASAVASRWLFVGDSPNDASAFAAMDLSVGVATVRGWGAKMPAWPRYLAAGGPGVGFAELVARLLDTRGSRP